MRLIVVILACLVSFSDARATTKEFFKWQSDEFAAALRYLEHGRSTPGVNDIYAREIGRFTRLENVRTALVCPGETRGTTEGHWTFFGARFLPLPANSGDPSFFVMSYLGRATGFHNGKSFDALLSGKDIRGGAKSAQSCSIPDAGLSAAHIARHGYGHLTRSGNFAPLSWNSADIDGDGIGDFTIGGILYLSSENYAVEHGASRKGAEAAFFTSDGGVRLARLLNGLLSVERLEKGALKDEATFPVPDAEVNAGHALMVLPGSTQSGDLIAVRQASCGIQSYHFKDATLSKRSCIGGLVGSWALPGARGDFDKDGVEDFWISQTNIGKPISAGEDHISLISGAAWRRSTGNVDVKALTIVRLNGSTQYSDYDGISTTLSPYAGDIDADGIPDISFSGHRHMNEAGALYILYGKDIVRGLAIDITDRRVQKIAGQLMVQLAPPYHHWDATDWDGDGHTDIVVTADNDLASGINAGAVYVLSGASIAKARTAVPAEKGYPKQSN